MFSPKLSPFLRQGFRTLLLGGPGRFRFQTSPRVGGLLVVLFVVCRAMVDVFALCVRILQVFQSLVRLSRTSPVGDVIGTKSGQARLRGPRERQLIS